MIIGGLARFLYPGEQRLGCLGTLVLGVSGAIVGGIVWNVLLQGEPYRPGGWIMSTIGAVIVLWVAEKLGGPRPPVS